MTQKANAETFGTKIGGIMKYRDNDAGHVGNSDKERRQRRFRKTEQHKRRKHRSQRRPRKPSRNDRLEDQYFLDPTDEEYEEYDE